MTSRDPITPASDSMLAWPLYGTGLENLGQDGRPVCWPIPHPAADQILVRSDAVGLCYSDVKIIRQGGNHPRLYGRDLSARPVVQGHEVALTVVEVGEAWRDRFAPGDRLALQADIYYRGRNLAYGYVFLGGLAQYSLLGPAALDGDEGCYAIPVPAGLGYAEVALTEPWACVEAAYVPRRRLHVKRNGTLWLLGHPSLSGDFRLGDAFAGGLPRVMIATDVPASLIAQIPYPEVVIRDGLRPTDFTALAAELAPGGFDDVIVLEPSPDVLDALPSLLAAGGVVNLVGQTPLGRAVSVDAGRIHYDYITYLGTSGHDIGSAYGDARNRADIRHGGVAWVVGGGGPMGRMHLQRMLEMPDPPRKVVVSETNSLRNAELTAAFVPLAQARGVELVVLNPRGLGAASHAAKVRAARPERGFDDIIVVVAQIEALESAMPHLAADGLLQVFGGLGRGTLVQLDLSNVYLGAAQITGSAGSTIGDQAAVLAKVAAGHLSTAAAVAAIGGLDAAREGIQGLMDGRFPGKMVIFPQVPDFPLTALADLAASAPEVHALLGTGGEWTRAAELAFLRRYAPHAYGP